jgi:hypothetical protein
MAWGPLHIGKVALTPWWEGRFALGSVMACWWQTSDVPLFSLLQWVLQLTSLLQPFCDIYSVPSKKSGNRITRSVVRSTWNGHRYHQVLLQWDWVSRDAWSPPPLVPFSAGLFAGAVVFWKLILPCIYLNGKCLLLVFCLAFSFATGFYFLVF